MQETLTRLLVYVPILLLGLSAHEAAHAWVAFKRGDPTAKDLGRVTLLPFAHLDLWGSLVVPVMLLAVQAPFLFGYAKPTPVNPAKLRSPKRDFSAVALAGPGANFLLALVFVGLGALLFRGLGVENPEARLLVGAGIVINVLLAWINLLPLPGFDGLKALYVFLPDEWCWRLQKGNQLIFPVLVLVLVLGLLNMALVPAFSIGAGLCSVAGAGQPPL